MSGRDRLSYTPGEYREVRIIRHSLNLQFIPHETSS